VAAVAPQVDVHEPLLTVRETLEFAAACCVATHGAAEASEAERALRARLVDHVIDTLGLRECEGVIVGDAQARGPGRSPESEGQEDNGREGAAGEHAAGEGEGAAGREQGKEQRQGEAAEVAGREARDEEIGGAEKEGDGEQGEVQGEGGGERNESRARGGTAWPAR
jgi:hypothetical protein